MIRSGPGVRITPGEHGGPAASSLEGADHGETLPEVRLHYTTLGTPQRDAAGHVSNAVLLLHGTTSTSKQFFSPTMEPELFGPGQPLDPSRYFVIVPGRGT